LAAIYVADNVGQALLFILHKTKEPMLSPGMGSLPMNQLLTASNNFSATNPEELDVL
jgi:hypothetical protein